MRTLYPIFYTFARFLYPRGQNNFFFRLEFRKLAFIKRISDVFHKMIVEPEVMHYRKTLGEHFLTAEQMPDICPAVFLTYQTAAFIVYRGHIGFVFFVVEIYNSL